VRDVLRPILSIAIVVGLLAGCESPSSTPCAQTTVLHRVILVNNWTNATGSVDLIGRKGSEEVIRELLEIGAHANQTLGPDALAQGQLALEANTTSWGTATRPSIVSCDWGDMEVVLLDGNVEFLQAVK
jgi:hypothetical protein